MRLKEIEARIARIEASHRADPFAGMTCEEIEAKVQRKLERLIQRYGSFAAVVAAMEASGEYALREGARLMVKRYGATHDETRSVAA
ncbi:hypothetical protein MKK88_26860 [Methylobacterium sp. E-005]|uniref:hypothetical protein n=1 Tax=Methylobacterium sp. E-005 TaxID=2836549 RepID=UPI001FB97F12|nr:hypothetical protein [Methylobacterium sp. E-005]MCJ2089582.1 hypothetical protein [Methylobacterium sp. E-005]